MSDEDFLAEFRIEAEELLAEAEEVLLKVESTDDFSGEFNKIFRSFHSLKGAAGMFEIDDLQSFMHTIEDQFESTRDNGKMDQQQVDYFLMAIDSARKILEGQAATLDTSTFGAKEEAPKPEVETKAKELREEAKEKYNSSNTESAGLVYVVDDEEFICEALADILRDHNFEAVTFSDPKEVLDAVNAKSPDLICTDLKMPEMSGLELLNQMREHKHEFPVVFITGFIDNDLLTDGLKNGASGFLEKPFEEHQVIGLISNAIERIKTWKLLNKSINYILYQFNDLDKFLEQQGRHTVRKSLRAELQELLKLKKSLSHSKANK